MTAEDLISHLHLAAHPLEGGYFKRIYGSSGHCETARGRRRICTSIHYLLTRESPIGYLHKNESDILHFFQLGSALRYHLVSPQGDYHCVTLGSDIGAGEKVQLLVPGGYWKASELIGDVDYGLNSEVVTPGFEYADNLLADPAAFAVLSGAWRECDRIRLTGLVKGGHKA